MTNQVWRCLLLWLVFYAAPSWADHPFTNKWGPFTGTIVDAETDKPIPGAIFVVMWIRNMPLGPQRFNDARAAVTDEAGRFALPERPAPFWGRGVDPPGLFFLAPGYAAFYDVGAQHKPMRVRLKSLLPGRGHSAASWTEPLGMIPYSDRVRLERSINERRQQLGLPMVDFAVGHLEVRKK